MSLTSRVENAANFVAESVDPFVPAVAKNAAGFVADSARSAIEKTLEWGKVVVSGATTTITAYTPEPILNIINKSLSSVQELAEHPVQTVKGYVPTFVVHAGEKTFEIFAATADSTRRNVEATSGFIVTKVNGVVTAVSQVPLIHSLFEQINKVIGKTEKTE